MYVYIITNVADNLVVSSQSNKTVRTVVWRALKLPVDPYTILLGRCRNGMKNFAYFSVRA